MFSELIKQGRFVITTEGVPPRGADVRLFKQELAKMKVDAVNIVDIPGSRLQMSSFAGSLIAKEVKKEPIMQVTCRDRNVLALQADLIAASALDITNILCLTGDHPSLGDHPDAKPVFDLDAVRLLTAIHSLNRGFAVNGDKLTGRTNLFAGAGISVASPFKKAEAFKTKQKINAGARFFQTQVVFDLKDVEEFFSAFEAEFEENIRKITLVGVFLLSSCEQIDDLKTLPGINIPEKVEKRMRSAKRELEEGTNIALEMVDGLKSMGIGGAHLVADGNITLLSRIIEELRK